MTILADRKDKAAQDNLKKSLDASGLMEVHLLDVAYPYCLSW
jgi:hypothetical protein